VKSVFALPKNSQAEVYFCIWKEDHFPQKYKNALKFLLLSIQEKSNMSTYLDFEAPLQALQEQISQTEQIGITTEVDMSENIAALKEKYTETAQALFTALTPWQRVQLSRHPDRPYTLAYINAITDNDFLELHGDRGVKDDKAMVGGFGSINGKTVMFIGQQKGINTKMRQYRNFGMPNPEGYRKALRLMKLAEKFNKPIVTFIDTPGAFPGLEAEERGQGEAIARNICELMRRPYYGVHGSTRSKQPVPLNLPQPTCKVLG